jgi:hypothetical protein
VALPVVVEARAVADHLGRLQHDVVVPAEHHVDARRVLDHLAVVLEAEVRDEHDHVDRRAQQVDVELRDLDRVHGRDAEPVGRVEDRVMLDRLPMPMTATLRPSRLKHGERLEQRAEGRGPGLLRILEQVVGREDGEARVLELEPQVEPAVVELVVGDDHRVGAHRTERLDLGLAVVEVEDGRALEAVAAVEVQGALRASALAPHDVADARGAADVDDAARLAEPEARVDLAELQVVREEARVDVARVDEREVHLPLLKRARREALTLMGDALALARASARVEAMILVEGEIARAADVFPLYYQDIRDHHIVLHGSDPFGGLVIESHHLRLRIEQELRDVSVRLRRSVTDARGDDALLAEAVNRKLKRIRFPLRTLLRLLGEEVTDDLRIVLERAGRRFRVDATAFAHVAAKPRPAHDELATLLDRAIEAVDKLHDPEPKA